MKKEKRDWYVTNHKGDLAGHDMSKISAKSLAYELSQEEPDAEWEALKSE